MPISSLCRLKHLTIMGSSMLALGLALLIAAPAHSPNPSNSSPRPRGSALRRYIKPALPPFDFEALPGNDLYDLSDLELSVTSDPPTCVA